MPDIDWQGAACIFGAVAGWYARDIWAALTPIVLGTIDYYWSGLRRIRAR